MRPGVVARHRVIGQEAADRPVDVPDRELALLDVEQRPVERAVQCRFLPVRAAQRRALGRGENVGQVDAAVAPVRERLVGVEQVDATDEVLEARDAEPRHQLTHLFGDEEEEVDDVLRLAGEALA